jgi:hypothetical protein
MTNWTYRCSVCRNMSVTNNQRYVQFVVIWVSEITSGMFSLSYILRQTEHTTGYLWHSYYDKLNIPLVIRDNHITTNWTYRWLFVTLILRQTEHTAVTRLCSVCRNMSVTNNQRYVQFVVIWVSQITSGMFSFITINWTYRWLFVTLILRQTEHTAGFLWHSYYNKLNIPLVICDTHITTN